MRALHFLSLFLQIFSQGHNLPDGKGNRYCINLVSVCGNPVPEEEEVPKEEIVEEQAPQI